MTKYLFLLLSLILPSIGNSQQVITLSPNAGLDDAIICDSLGRLYGAHYKGSAVFRYDPSNWTPQVFSDGYNTPNGLAFGKNGYLYMADNRGNKIYQIDSDGNKSIFVDNFFSPSGIIFELDSDTMIVTSYEGHRIVKIGPDGGQREWTKGDKLNGPVGFCYDDEGRLYTSNFNNRKIIRLEENGDQHEIIQIQGGGYLGFIAYAKGYIYATMFSQHKIYRTDLEGNGEYILGGSRGSVDGDANTARFNTPNGIMATQSQDTLYISDHETRALRMITNFHPVSTSTLPSPQPKLGIKLTPNPASSLLHLHLDLELQQTLKISIIDQSGKLVKVLSEGKTSPKGKQIIPVGLDSLQSGIYQIQIQTSDGLAQSLNFVKS